MYFKQYSPYFIFLSRLENRDDLNLPNEVILNLAGFLELNFEGW